MHQYVRLILLTTQIAFFGQGDAKVIMTSTEHIN